MKTSALATLSIAILPFCYQTLAIAGCPCKGNVSGGTAGVVVSPSMTHAGLPVDSNFVAGPVAPLTTAAPLAPPPGTIGQTYQLPSRPVPVGAHPRTGMIDIRVVGAAEVTVHDVNAYRTEDTLDGFRDGQDLNLWHFESEPLLPGLSHIYRVEAKYPAGNGFSTDERYVRLIRGRVVMLTF